MFKLETNADWRDVHQAQIVNPRKHSVSKLPAVSAIALAHPVIKLLLPVNALMLTNVLPVWPHPALRELNVPIKKVLSLVLVQVGLPGTLIMDSVKLWDCPAKPTANVGRMRSVWLQESVFAYHLSSLTSKMETGKTVILVDLKKL